MRPKFWCRVNGTCSLSLLHSLLPGTHRQPEPSSWHSRLGTRKTSESTGSIVPQANKSDSPKESDAYPALPEDGYGWEKLFSERMCRHFHEDYGIATRIGRYHNVYGPWGTYDGGREKAPAAICRKVAAAKRSGSREIEIWGDGEQTRSFMYIDDCTKGTYDLTQSNIIEPLNIGSSELVSINQLVSIVEDIAGVKSEALLKA